MNSARTLAVRFGAALWMAATLPAAMAQSPRGEADAPIEVAVAAASVQSVATGYELDGVIEPVRQSTVSAQASGRVAKLQVRAGDEVRAGQLLVTIDDREARAGVQSSQAQVAQAQSALRNAEINARRVRQLRPSGAVSQAMLDDAETQLSSAKAARDQAQAAARQSTLAQDFTRVVAPFNGWVLQTLVNTGDLAMPGKPLLTLYAPRPIRAVVQVPSSRGEAARAAERIEVRVPGGQWISPVSRIVLPAADPVAQTVEWRLDLPDADSQGVLPGQQVRVRFAGASAQRVVVPGSAILRRGELTAVYVAQGSGFVLKAVRLGADHGEQGVEVLAGLAPGAPVALDPVRAGLASARVAPREGKQ